MMDSLQSIRATGGDMSYQNSHVYLKPTLPKEDIDIWQMALQDEFNNENEDTMMKSQDTVSVFKLGNTQY